MFFDFQNEFEAFQGAAEAASAQLEVIEHPLSETVRGGLRTSLARVGDEDAETVIFLTSGIHGAELAPGSWCQTDLLHSGRLGALPKGTAVVFIHAINPWGAAMGRRFTEENVDLCRNFIDFDRDGIAPLASYDRLQPLFDAAPQDVAEADIELARFAAEQGVARLYAAVMSGQYRDAAGVGFGGHGPTWARRTLEGIMREHAGRASRVYALDYHTGVGPYGYGSVIAMQTGARLERARQVFGPWVLAPRENPPPGFIDVTGHSTDGYEALFPNADVMAGVLEVGTYPQDVFLARLLAEHRATRAHGADSDNPVLAQARVGLVDFFVPKDPHWRAYVRHRGRQAFEQIMEDVTRDN